jgi:beta-barrel assembly-enhancing protease
MKNWFVVLSILLFWAGETAFAQFPRGLKEKITSVTDKYKDLEITDEEEARLGANISERIRNKFGVVQDPEAHKYVSMVGAVLTRRSSRPNLPYHFIILDTDGVNAFAAPGGFVHVTRGALAMMKTEAQLAGVLGHELIHVTDRHAMRAIQKNKALQMAAGQQNLASNPELFHRVEDEMFKVVFAGFGRTEEMESDEKGVRLAESAGYDPTGLEFFLQALKERNARSDSKQGLFASHPEINDRIQKIEAMIQKESWRGGATNPDRLEKNVKYQPVPLAGITAVQDGSSGLAGESQPENKDKDKEANQQEQPKKSRFSLSKIKNPLGGGSEKTQSAEVTGSGGSRGVDKEQNAQGGTNPSQVVVVVTEPELQSFIKEGGLRG